MPGRWEIAGFRLFGRKRKVSKVVTVGNGSQSLPPDHGIVRMDLGKRVKWEMSDKIDSGLQRRAAPWQVNWLI